MCRKRSDTCFLIRVGESSSKLLRSHVPGLNSVLGLLVLCGLSTGAGEVGETLVLVGLVTLCTGLAGWGAG